ncbi:MAG: capsular biosynthesis protein [Verrucomicrobiota bacterium]
MIVFPMAGASSRFLRAGYEVEKFRLRAHGLSLFTHAVSGFERYFEEEPFLFIHRGGERTRQFIEQECEAMGLPNMAMVDLNSATRGQAETVALGLEANDCCPSESLTIFNIDTFRPGFSYPAEFSIDEIDGYLEVFSGEGEHWSFVLPSDENPEEQRVGSVAEKVRISSLCSTGLYFFREASSFLQKFEQVKALDRSRLQGGEYYVAPLYNDLIEEGLDIRYHLIDASEVVHCGTPEDYERFKGE